MRSVLEAGFGEIHLQMLLQKIRAVVEWFRIRHGALNQHLFLFAVGHLDVQNQGVVDEYIHDTRFIEFAQAAADIVDKMRVAINIASLVNKMRNIVHCVDLGLAINRLALDEITYLDTAEIRVTQFADETQHRPQIVDPDIVLDVDPVVAQQLFQKRNLDRLVLDHVDDVFIEVAGSDTVITRVVKPVITAQLGRQI